MILELFIECFALRDDRSWWHHLRNYDIQRPRGALRSSLV